MNRNKSKKIVIILIIIVLILILLGGVAYAYLTTDILKSNKKLFFKYTSQLLEENGIIEEQLKQYYEKQRNMPFSNSGNFYANISSENQNIESQFKNTNNMDITFSGQIDNQSHKMIQNISINYSDGINFPLTFKRVGDNMGLQSKYVGKKYVTININDGNNSTSSEETNIQLNEVVQKIEKIKELFNENLSKEQINYIKDTYIGIIDKNLQDSNFTKLEENGKIGYKITLTVEEQKNIISKILGNLKNDKFTLDTLNEIISKQDRSSQIKEDDIDDIIEELNRDTKEMKDISIIIYQEKGRVTKLSIESTEYSAIIEKTASNNELQYNISIEMLDANAPLKLYINIKYNGLNSMQNIEEKYEIGIKYDTYSYKYNFNNKIEFQQSSNVEEFTQDNSLDLNSLEDQQRAAFINAAIQRITEVNAEQMEQLGVSESENPLMYIIPSLGIFSGGTNVINNDAIDEVEIDAFNEKFQVYEGKNLKGVTVKGLFTTIQNNNEIQKQNRKIEEINFDGDEYEATSPNIALLKSTIETEASYKVEFEKQENTGIIYRVVINKK